MWKCSLETTVFSEHSMEKDESDENKGTGFHSRHLHLLLLFVGPLFSLLCPGPLSHHSQTRKKSEFPQPELVGFVTSFVNNTISFVTRISKNGHLNLSFLRFSF